MLYAVINKSTLVSAADLASMVAACQKQLTEDVALAWESAKSPTVMVFADEAAVPADAAITYIMDNAPDAPGELGDHTETNDRVVSRILAGVVLSNGGAVLYNADSSVVTVSSVLSHELCEQFGNPCINRWCDGPQIAQGSEYASELSDPVQGGAYPINIGTDAASVLVMVSDFVTPRWFDPEATTGPFHKLNTLTAPFTMSAGGYMIVRNGPGTEQQVFGDACPAWRVNMKKASSRFGAMKVAMKGAMKVVA